MNRLLIFLFLIAAGCSSNSSEEFRSEARDLSRVLIAELKEITSHDDFASHSARLKKLFFEQAQIMVRINRWNQEHHQASHLDLSAEDSLLSQKLKEELARIYKIEGGRKFLERCQEESLHFLDAAVKIQLKP